MIIVQAKAIPKDETSKNKIIEAAANLIEKSKLETLCAKSIYPSESGKMVTEE